LSFQAFYSNYAIQFLFREPHFDATDAKIPVEKLPRCCLAVYNYADIAISIIIIVLPSR
jgi:hypothetical protein